jgi:hypothetical protein
LFGCRTSVDFLHTRCCSAGSQYQFAASVLTIRLFRLWARLAVHAASAENFEYAYANQGNFSEEHQLSKNMTLTASYLFVGAHHLPHRSMSTPRASIYRWRTSPALPAATSKHDRSGGLLIPSTSTAAIPLFRVRGVPLQCFALTTPAGQFTLPERRPALPEHFQR